MRDKHGMIVANLGHNPQAWMQRFMKHMQGQAQGQGQTQNQ